MHCHFGTNNRAPRWTFTDPCKPEVRPGAREESASPAWLAAPAMNARDTTKVYIWRLDTGCGSTLYRKCHSHNTPGKRHNNTWVKPLAGNCTTSSTPKNILVSSCHQCLAKLPTTLPESHDSLQPGIVFGRRRTSRHTWPFSKIWELCLTRSEPYGCCTYPAGPGILDRILHSKKAYTIKMCLWNTDAPSQVLIAQFKLSTQVFYWIELVV